MEKLKIDKFERGIITVAMGDYFCYMAENLFRSYKLFNKKAYPFYVLTDRSSAERLEKLFDGVLIIDNPHYNLMDKISIYENTPFQETIFLDSDCFVTGDIDFLFDRFEQNGSDVSCLGEYDPIGGSSKYNYSYNYFHEKVIKDYGFDKYIRFSGGMYFFRKSPVADEMMLLCKNNFVPNYDEVGLSRHGSRKSDECVISTGMLIFGMRPLTLPENSVMGYVYQTDGKWDSDNFNPRRISWDMKPNSFYSYKDKKRVNLLIPHWMTPLTKNVVYYNFAERIKFLYEKRSFPPTSLYIICKDIEYYIALFWGKIKTHIAKGTEK